MKKFYFISIYIIAGLMCICLTASAQGLAVNTSELPAVFKQSVKEISIDKLGSNQGKKEVKKINDNTVHVKLVFDLEKKVQQDDWQIRIVPNFTPTFNWAPHLTPTDINVIDQHVFRAPVLIVSNEKQVLYVYPDVEMLGKGSPVRWYMDMDAPNNNLMLGMTNNRVSEHVLFDRETGATYPKGKVEYGFYIMCYTNKETIENPFRKPLAYYWKNHGHSLYKAGKPISNDLEPYVKHTYNWAFNTWKNVWQEFNINGKKVGAPVCIVNVTQSPNYPGEVNEREFHSIWNQSWFSSLRSASGVYRYARRTGNEALMEKANLSKELMLSHPQKNGFFYGLIGTEMEEVEIEGKKYNRSKGWDHYYWGNSNRNPYTWNPAQSPFHVVDMSWTALIMLRWYDELEADPRLLAYAEEYGKSLIAIQSPDGFFPGWLDLNTLKPMQHLNQSPETSMSVTFLLKLYEITKNETYKTAALKAIQAVMDNIIPVGRWEDVETYWSCCRYGSEHLVGKKEIRNNMYKQCNLSMFWTSEALFECYKSTDNEKYLKAGQRTLDEMLMTQSAWQPPYIYIEGFGGFGVMNADGEWTDARQSLFAEIILQYGKLMNIPEYTERGIAALKSSFVMMYCPENPVTKKQWEKVWPFFGPEDYGFTMENYAHEGRTSPEGEGMGEFTVYDWGNGAASEAYNRIIDKFGKEYIR